jgi:hypothetical protein
VRTAAGRLRLGPELRASRPVEGTANGSANDAAPVRERALLRRPAWMTSADAIAVALYLAIATAIALPFSLDGRPLMGGDNLYQNFPLRVLAGRYIAAGHLPGWDPFIWSGTPLLAGWNAGALFPGTWLFAVLPAVGAWTLNIILVPAVAATGAYAFLRRLECGTLASFLGGLVFTYTGFMSGQAVHLGLVQGTAMLPWLLLGIESLARRRPGQPALRWVVLIAFASALTVLAGDPRAVSTMSFAVLVYLLAWLLRDPRTLAVQVLPGALAGGILGAFLSAVQWLPGIGFLRSSQRGVNASALFSAGSLSLPHIGGLLTVPFLLGGSTNFHLLVYQGLDNIQELTIGVGLVGLVAAFAYLPALARSFASWCRRMVRPASDEAGAGLGLIAGQPAGSRRLAVWYAMGLCGVVLTMGSDTRLGSVLQHLPLYGGERLQNRSAELIDLALVVLLAFLVDDLVGRTRSAVSAWRPLASTTSALLGSIAPLAALGLILAAFGAPLRIERLLEMPVPHEPKLFVQLAPYLWASAGFAVLLVAFLCGLPRLGPGWRRGLLVAFVLGDVLTYALNASYAAPPVSRYNGSTSGADHVRAAAGPGGRFAIFDPLFSFPVTGMAQPDEIGLPNLNILQRTSSVEGYGSIVDGTYQNSTDTHGVEDLNERQLAGTTFDTLDLGALLTLPVYIWRHLARGTTVPVPGVGPGLKSPAAPPDASGPYILQPGQSMTFVMAERSALVRASAILDPVAPNPPATLRIAEGDALDAGATPLTVHGGIAVRGFPSGVRVDSVTVQDSSDVPAVIGAVTIVTRHPAERYVLDGWLQGDVAPPHWRFAGYVPTAKGDNFLVFENTQNAGAAWLQHVGDTSPEPLARIAGGSVRLVHEPVSAPQTMEVDTPVPAQLVRSTEYAAGWTATVTPLAGGRALHEPAQQFGLVQMVHIPAGRFVVTWRYAPRALRAGAWASLLGVLALLALGLATVLRRRQRHPRGRVIDEPATG